MNQNINLKTLKKLIIKRSAVLALSGVIGITLFKFTKDGFIKNNKYKTIYKTYSTLTDDTTLEKENIKGNEEEIIMKVYREDKNNTGTRTVDTYYLKKDEAYELMDYLNLKDDVIRFNTYTEEYHGTNEEYTEVSSVQNIEVDDSIMLKAILIASVPSILPAVSVYTGCVYNDVNTYRDYPRSLAGRIKLYNELKKEEEPKKKIKKL